VSSDLVFEYIFKLNYFNMVDNTSESVSHISGTTSNKSTAAPQMFIDSHKGNIKEQYHFNKKLANGGFGVVYLAEHR